MKPRRDGAHVLAESELPQRELRTYRILAGIAAVLFVAFGMVHARVDATAVDPPLERGAATLLALTLLALSYVRAVRSGPWLGTAFRAGCYLVTLWVIQLLWLNDFDGDYAMALLVAVPVAASTYRSSRRLALYLVLTNAALVAAWVWARSPRTSPQLVVSYVAGISLLSYVLVRWSLHTAAELAASRERYELAARGANDGLWDWDVVAGSMYYSPRWKTMLDYRASEIGSSVEDWLSRVHPEDVEGLRSALESHLLGGSAQFHHEYRVRDAAGEWRWMLARGVAVRDGAGRATRMAGSQTDIGAWKRAEARLLHDAFHDPLTDLPNRALFLDRLGRVSQRSRRRAAQRYAVLFLDLDRFKLVNDGLGHLVGDELLKIVARRLLACVRQEDTVARLGGDEFGILLSEVRGVDDATRVAERVNAALQQPMRIGRSEVFTSASIGVALSARGYARPEETLRDADTAMYRAKAAGGMRHELAGGEMHTEAVDRLKLEGELRRAVERGELRVQYQPVVELPAGRLVGFEALLRWQHAERGLLMPDDFIPMAEETGIIVALDWWVLYRACEQAARWATALDAAASDVVVPGGAARPLTLSVNLSGKHFWQEDLTQRLDRVLAETGARPEHLQLEITESAVMRDADAAARILADVRTRGIALAIDDFGSGYASLTYLQRFRLDTLKIDRSFVGGLGRDARSTELVRSVLALAGTLEVSAVAEGVERQEQADALVRLGCIYAQGFLFSQPLDGDAAAALLSLPALAS